MSNGEWAVLWLVALAGAVYLIAILATLIYIAIFYIAAIFATGIAYIGAYGFLLVVLPLFALACIGGAALLIWSLAKVIADTLDWDSENCGNWRILLFEKSLAIAYVLAILWLPLNILWLSNYPVDFGVKSRNLVAEAQSSRIAIQRWPTKVGNSWFAVATEVKNSSLWWISAAKGNSAAKAPKFLELPIAGKFANPLQNIQFRGSVGAFGAWRSHGHHKGLDLRAERGAPVAAAADGKVIFADWRGSYGKLVKVRHANGYETRYAHLSRILVKKNERVKRGQVIGRVGNTGNARGTAPHLHYEIRRNGRALNPRTTLVR